MSIFTPVNQIRLTNVAVVRQRKAGKRFEIACYPNKVTAWRSGVERDIDEVLQTHTVFSNVSKGAAAKQRDLLAAYGTDDQDRVCLEILARGEMQVSNVERQRDLAATFSEIATIVSDKCVDPTTGKPHTVGLIEKAMKDLHFSVSASRSAKQQALELVPKLAGILSIERAQMLLLLRLPAPNGARALKALGKLPHPPKPKRVDPDPTTGSLTAECLVDPGMFRSVDEVVRTATQGAGSVEVLQLRVTGTKGKKGKESGESKVGEPGGQGERRLREGEEEGKEKEKDSGAAVAAVVAGEIASGKEKSQKRAKREKEVEARRENQERDGSGSTSEEEEEEEEGDSCDSNDNDNGDIANNNASDEIDGDGGDGNEDGAKASSKAAAASTEEMLVTDVPGVSRSRRSKITAAVPGALDSGDDDSDDDQGHGGKRGKKKGKKGKR